MPAHAVTKPKVPRKEMKTLTDTQVRTLLLAARDTRFEALYQLAVTTGLRRGELVGLKWSDLDWSNRRLQVQRQLQRVRKRGLVFSEPKSASSRRVIILGASTIVILRQHKKQQHVERIFAGDKWQEHDVIFSTTIGTPLDPSNLNTYFKNLLEKAGLPRIRFHDLHRTAATLMLQQGIHPKVVQETLGHSQISITLDTYSHVLPSMQAEAADLMNELLFPIDVTEELAQFNG